MQLKPAPGQQYRDTRTHQLVDPEHGFDADPLDLDIARAIDCGDLVPVHPKRAHKPQAQD